MADAKKCDRCEKFYEENTITKRINGYIYKIGGITVLSTGESNVFYADLCDDCVKDLNKFLNGKLFTE